MPKVFKMQLDQEAQFPVHHEHDGEPIFFRKKDTGEWHIGYWSFGVGYVEDGYVGETLLFKEDEVDAVVLIEGH